MDDRSEWRALFERTAESLPRDPEGFLSSVARAEESARAELAAVLTPILNQVLASMPQETIDDKRHVASFVNRVAKQTGLAVAFPKGPLAGRPGILTAHRNASESYCYFVAEIVEDGRKRRASLNDPVEVSLVAAPPRRESGSAAERERRERLGGSRAEGEGGPSRS